MILISTHEIIIWSSPSICCTNTRKTNTRIILKQNQGHYFCKFFSQWKILQFRLDLNPIWRATPVLSLHLQQNPQLLVYFLFFDWQIECNTVVSVLTWAWDNTFTVIAEKVSVQRSLTKHLAGPFSVFVPNSRHHKINIACTCTRIFQFNVDRQRSEKTQSYG